MVYFTNAGPRAGLFRFGGMPGAIAVMDTPDSHVPIGMAKCLGPSTGGDRAALWKLYVRGVDLAGLWIEVGREFRPADEPGKAPNRKEDRGRPAEESRGPVSVN